MNKVRPSTQLHLDGGTPGQAMIVDPTGTFWQPGTPGNPGAGTNLGTSSLDTAGNLVLTYTTVYGINSTGQPYYDAAGPVAGEEAVLVVDPDGTLSLIQPGR